MAYMCELGLKTECDNCGMCKKEPETCPICGGSDWEYLLKQGNEVVGCDICTKKIWRD